MNETIQAMVFDGTSPILAPSRVPLPAPAVGQVRVKVSACGVCRTDLHVIDRELPHPKPALIPGHEIVGRIHAVGPGVVGLSLDQRVGVPWLGHTCGQCRFCQSGRENLCDTPLFHGYTRDGGYAEFVLADADYCFPVPECYDNEHAAPLLCAGLIGYRTLRMAGDARRIGIYGFGAAAHIVTQIAAAQGRTVFAFTKAGDLAAQQLATDVGAIWAGSSSERPPDTLDGALIPVALSAVDKGGTVVCGGIHMSDIPSFPYRHLWEERRLVSVANLTREDGRGLMRAAAAYPLKIRTTSYPLTEANKALDDLRTGRRAGAAILRIGSPTR